MLSTSKLRNKMMCATDCIRIKKNYKNKNFFVNYVKLEKDLIYYNFGYELFNCDDINFNIIEFGLKSINDFAEYLNTRKKFIRKMF